MWIVEATPPVKGWVFPKDFFPRKTRYKIDAERYAQEAKDHGGTNVKISKESDKDTPPT